MNLSGPGGVLTAALGLIVLERITSSNTASSGVASLLQLPGRLAQAWMDPATPLIPDRSGGSPSLGWSPSSVASAADNAFGPPKPPPPPFVVDPRHPNAGGTP